METTKILYSNIKAPQIGTLKRTWLDSFSKGQQVKSKLAQEIEQVRSEAAIIGNFSLVVR